MPGRPPPTADAAASTSEVTAAAGAVASAAAALPTGADYQFHAALTPSAFPPRAAALHARAAALASRLPTASSHAAARAGLASEGGGRRVRETAGALLDPLLAAAAPPPPRPPPPPPPTAGPKKPPSGAGAAYAADRSAGPRPQDGFSPRPDTRRGLAWRPPCPTPWLPGGDAAWGGASHPLAATLAAFEYAPWQVAPGPPVPPAPLDATPCQWVDSEAGLAAVARSLAAAPAFAFDLEAHSYRSFAGFTCLLQLSTRTADWVVDALALRASIGPALGPAFADPAVVKVGHGCAGDLAWLQRDFGICVANLFDTGLASRAVGGPAGSGSLAAALSHFCGVTLDKAWQLADWRARPLPAGALAYARADTHWLLHLADRLALALAAAPADAPLPVRLPRPLAARAGGAGVPPGPLGAVLEAGRAACGARYAPPSFCLARALADGAKAGLPPAPHPATAVYAALADWRDRTARARDESTGFVASAALLARLARAAPRSLPALASAVGRTPSLALELSGEVLAAVAAGVEAAASGEAWTAWARSGDGGDGAQCAATGPRPPAQQPSAGGRRPPIALPSTARPAGLGAGLLVPAKRPAPERGGGDGGGGGGRGGSEQRASQARRLDWSLPFTFAPAAAPAAPAAAAPPQAAPPEPKAAAPAAPAPLPVPLAAVKAGKAAVATATAAPLAAAATTPAAVDTPPVPPPRSLVDRIDADDPGSGRAGDGDSSSSDEDDGEEARAATLAAAVPAFDFAAALAAAPGIAAATAVVPLGGPDTGGRGGRGRGRGRGGRGGRGRPDRPVDALPAPPAPAFDPYSLPDANLMKGASSRVGSAPRSGNRTRTFGR